MDFIKLNEIAGNAPLPIKQLSKLERDIPFIITAFSMVEEKIFIEIDEEFQIALPHRVCKILNENKPFFEEIQAKANKLQLFVIYLGNGRMNFC